MEAADTCDMINGSLTGTKLERSGKDSQPRILCPITGAGCGDLSYLCEDYGCARKAGLSPHSSENV